MTKSTKKTRTKNLNKVRDLKPKKDAKGGIGSQTGGAGGGKSPTGDTTMSFPGT
jgi:hypothetical protein